MSDPHDLGDDLALPGIGTLLGFLAALLGFAGMSGASVASLGGQTLFEAVEHYRARRDRRAFRRLQRLVEGLDRRLCAVERDQVMTEQEVDLFVHVVECAVKDDEDAKAAFYEALLVWIKQRRPPTAQVRVLTDAVRSLSYLELYCFVHEVRDKSFRPRDFLASNGLAEHAFANRLMAVGLGHQTVVRYGGAPTEVGKALCDMVEYQRVTWPPTAPSAAEDAGHA